VSQPRRPRPLCEAVDALCRALLPHTGSALATEVHQVRARLQEPLEVAVTGRVSVGKSTLVNALIGRAVAPTSAGECTRLVTRFGYGSVDRVDVVLCAGGSVALGLDSDAAVPSDVATRAGVAVSEVSHLQVSLSSALLVDLAVIDTPGLGALERAPLAGAQHAAVAGADAVLHVLTHRARTEDTAALTAFTGTDARAAFRADTADRPPGPATVLAVLNKVDTAAAESVLGGDTTVWGAAQRLAAEQSAVLGSLVVDVLPAVGLLAQTCETGSLSAADVATLRALATGDDATRSVMLASTELFTSLECAVAPGERARLLDKLDLYGVQCAVRLLQADPAVSAGRLRAALYDASGMAALRRRLDTVLTARADVIKAAAALATLDGLARRSPVPAEQSAVREGVEGLLALPQAHELRVAEVLSLLTSGAVTLPADLLTEVLALASEREPAARLAMAGDDRAEMTARALDRAGWWRSFASFGASPPQARVAHVVHRAYYLLWQQLTAHGQR